MNTRRLLLLALAAASLIFAGCEGTMGNRGDNGGAGAQVVEGGAQTQGARGSAYGSGNALEDPNGVLAQRKIYFDFDQSEIRAEYIDVLRAHADYLSRNRLVNVTIEGHCDERGSREYNIGLGERRANTIKRFLEAEGVESSQINTISYGEERPEAFGNDESAWSMNRRGVLVY